MSVPLRVLIVEDSEDDAFLLVRELERGGYAVTFERVETPQSMGAALDHGPWDLVVSDYSMPHFSGTAALALVTDRGLDVPFIFVSGTIGEETAVAAMKAGANDYIMKDNLRRLIPAIERELRDAEVRRARREAEEALHESEARYRAMVENATYGIYRSSAEGRFVDVNPALVRMLGYDTKEELLQLDLATAVYFSAADRAQALALTERLERFQGVELDWKRRDGRSIRVRLSGRILRDERGAMQGCEAIAEDITERRAMERQISALQKFEAIGRLAGGIAHDFNNVLGAIIGWADMLVEETSEGSRTRSHARKVQDQAQRAASLTRQLLAFARRQVLEPRNIDLNQSVLDVLGLLEKLIGPGIETHTVLAPDLSVTHADPSQVEQVLMNLCLNARDAMPRGGRLLIETQNARVDEEYTRQHPYVVPGEYVLLAVSDTGVGMDNATAERIFEPFFTTKETGKGTGLGLATVYGIVKQHGGFIHVYSELGQGATFRVYLPAVAGTVASHEKSAQTAAVRGGNETILVAEDHDGLRELAKMALEALGYEILLAADGKEAVDLFRGNKDKIALVVLDVVMPKMDGPAIYAELSNLSPGLPVIFTTGYSSEMAFLNSILEKGVTVLQKPYSPQALGKIVREVLDRSTQKGEA